VRTAVPSFVCKFGGEEESCCWVCVIFFACVCVWVRAATTTASDDPLKLWLCRCAGRFLGGSQGGAGMPPPGYAERSAPGGSPVGFGAAPQVRAFGGSAPSTPFGSSPGPTGFGACPSAQRSALGRPQAFGTGHPGPRGSGQRPEIFFWAVICYF
jgi:hypothetical protein